MRISFLASALPMLALFTATAAAAVPDSTTGPRLDPQDNATVRHFAPPPAYAPDRILVKFQPGAAAAEIGQLMRQSGAKPIKVISGIDVHVLQVPEGTVEEEVNRFAHNPNVLYAEPDRYRLLTAQYLPSEGDGNVVAGDYFSEQWALNNTGQWHSEVVDTLFGPVLNSVRGNADADIDAPEAWSLTKGSPDVKIAILDSGMDCRVSGDSTSSIELGNGKCVEQISFVTGYSNTLEDLVGHGTHVAGIAASATDNGIGIAGVGFSSSIGNLKTCFEYDTFFFGVLGVCPLSASLAAIAHAADMGYHVINMSFATDQVDEAGNVGDVVGYSVMEAAAVADAWNRGVVLVAAAGNSGDKTKNYPAAYPEVIAVGATDHYDDRASYSTFDNIWVSLMAPGDNILSLLPNDFCGTFDFDNDACVHWLSGTSMASPHVAGAAALVWAYLAENGVCDPVSRKDGLGNNCNILVRQMLESGADQTGAGGQNMLVWSQHGRLNVYGALMAGQVPPLPPPMVDSVMANTNGTVTVHWTYTGYNAGFEVQRETKHPKRETWQSQTSVGLTPVNVFALVDTTASGEVHYRAGAIQADGSRIWGSWSVSVKVASSGGGKGGGKPPK